MIGHLKHHYRHYIALLMLAGVGCIGMVFENLTKDNTLYGEY